MLCFSKDGVKHGENQARGLRPIDPWPRRQAVIPDAASVSNGVIQQFRPQQVQSLEFIFQVATLPTGAGRPGVPVPVSLLEAPTGIGKSAIVAALPETLVEDEFSAPKPLTVLVHTRALGWQYEKYGFYFLPGRSTFDCVLPQKAKAWARMGKRATAAHCHYAKMTECPAADECPYLIAKAKAQSAMKLAVTYPYALLSEWLQKRPGIVACDEAHHVPDALLSHGTLTLTDEDAKEWGFDPWPDVKGKEEGVVLSEAGMRAVKMWLGDCRLALEKAAADWTIDGSKVLNIKQKLDGIISQLDNGEWFYRAGGIRWGKGANAPFELLPLWPGSTWSKIAGGAGSASPRVVVMLSATIGKMQTLMTEIGVADWRGLSLPHPTPISARPVFDLGMERMSYYNIKRNPKLLETQARRISAWIMTKNRDWRALALTTSNAKVDVLHKIMSQVLTGRVLPLGGSSEARAAAFLKDTRRGAILVGPIQGLGHGLDLSWDLCRLVAIAGVPHAVYNDAYIKARTARPGGQDFELWKAYMAVVQGSGRHTRSEQLPDGNYLLNETLLADGLATEARAREFYPAYYNEAIQKL